MAKSVVYELEAVEVDVEHSHGAFTPRRASERHLEVLLKQPPVRQVGELVVTRPVCQLYLGSSLLRDVAEAPHTTHHIAVEPPEDLPDRPLPRRRFRRRAG